MENNNKKVLYTIIIILIIIIIILLLLTKCEKTDNGYIEQPKVNDKDKIDDNNKKNNETNQTKEEKTEQVDKEIKINKDSNNKNSTKVNENTISNTINVNTNSGNNSNKNNTFNDNDDKEDLQDENLGELIIDWEENNQVKIFDNNYFNESKIAPGVHGDYTFSIKNERTVKVKYNIELTDTNTYNINMKYRLKKGSEYVVGSDTDWVSVSDVIYKNNILDKNETDIYTLEWVWQDSDNDTNIGESVGANYSLNINIYGEDINE